MQKYLLLFIPPTRECSCGIAVYNSSRPNRIFKYWMGVSAWRLGVGVCISSAQDCLISKYCTVVWMEFRADASTAVDIPTRHTAVAANCACRAFCITFIICVNPRFTKQDFLGIKQINTSSAYYISHCSTHQAFAVLLCCSKLKQRHINTTTMSWYCLASVGLVLLTGIFRSEFSRGIVTDSK